MCEIFKKYRLLIGVLAVIMIVLLAFSAIMSVRRFFREDSMTTEEWAIMMLTDYREDVEAAVTDMQTRQEQGIAEVYIQKVGGALEISLTSAASYKTEILTGSELYERLIKKCMSITLHENGAISFSRRGFLTGYTGFYYSPTGMQTDIESSADWYETGRLEENYFWYAFGY